MIAVITGDIINSREDFDKGWLDMLKKVLRRYGKWPTSWEVYRGDSFQMSCSVAEALQAAIHIKATMRQVAKLDVRMAIGIGDVDLATRRITESNGSAFVRSGTAFDALKKHRLVISSPWDDFDEQFNLYFRLAAFAMDHWTVAQAALVKYLIEYPDRSQKVAARKFKISQSTISERLRSSGYTEVRLMLQRYKKIVITR